MKTIQKDTTNEDFRAPTATKKLPRSVADGANGLIIAVAEVSRSPERVIKALTTNEVEKWWGASGFYTQKDWRADLRVCGSWSVNVELGDGTFVHAEGEFCEIDAPSKLVMTRRFDKHPFQGTRETTITYRLAPSENGTFITVREEGLIGRMQAAHGNAEHWERVLGWLDAYLSAE